MNPPSASSRNRSLFHFPISAVRQEVIAPLAASLAALLAAGAGIGQLGRLPGGVFDMAPDLHGMFAVAAALLGLEAAFQWPRPVRRSLCAAAAAMAGAAVLQDGAVAPWTLAALVLLCARPFALAADSGAQRAVLALVGLAMLWAACGAALATMVPSALLLDRLALEGGLSWPGTAVQVLLATAGSARLLQHPAMRAFFDQRKDRKTFTIYTAMLLGAIAAAVMLTAILLTVRTIEGVRPLLLENVQKEAQALNLVLRRVADAADSAAAGLANLPRDAALARPQARLDALQHQLEPMGQTAIALSGPEVGLLVRGTLEDGPWLRLATIGTQRVSISQHQGWVVQLERSIAGRAGERLLVQVRPFEASAQLPPFEIPGSGALAMVCADGGSDAICLSKADSAFSRMALPPRADGREWPARLAWRGLDGVLLLRGPNAQALMVAYAPIGHSGAGLLQRISLTELVRGIDNTVRYVLAALLALAAGGVALLYASTFPGLRELRYAKALIEATLGNLPRAVLTLDSQGAIRASNAVAHRLFAMSEAELDRRDISTLLGAADAEGRETGPWLPHAGALEALLHSAGGETIPVETQVREFSFEDRTHMVLIVRDLRRELAQRAELARWGRIFFHAGWGVAASSAEGRALDQLNPAFAQMHGYDMPELVGQPLERVVAPQSRAQAARHLALVLIGAHGNCSYESVHLRRDGTSFPVLVDLAIVPAEGRRSRFWVVNVQDMTERRRIQDAIQRSEALLQLVLKSLPVGVWIADREGRVTSTNPAVDQLWRGTLCLVDGRPVTPATYRIETGRMVPPDDYPMLRAVRTGVASLGELLEIRCDDGSHYTLLNSAVPLIGPDGTIQGAISVNEDLTQMRRAELAIMEARNFFESLFRSAAMGMAVWNAEGRFERVNQSLCELLCRTEDSLLMACLDDVRDSEFAESDRQLMASMRAGAVDKVKVERRWRRCDGREVWVLMVVSLVRLPGAEEAQFVAQLVDIDASRRFQQALQASETRLRNANHIARLADWEWNLTDGEVSLSEEGRQMLGLPYTRDGTIHESRWLERVHPDDLGRLYLALAAAGSGQQALDIDYRLRSADGMERVFHQQAPPLDPRRRDDHASPRLVGVLQDITERKRVENELLASRQRLRELSANEESRIEQERRHIAREVHDELGQSLTALKMELAMLHRRLAHAPPLEQQAEKIIGMVESTIEVVRHVASNLRPSALDFGLVAAIEWLAEDFALRWEMPCEVFADDLDIALGEASSTALFRLVQESLTNIARHAGARRVEIHLACDRQGLRLSIEDDGVGFDLALVHQRGHGFGLLGMRERALKIGARLNIEARPGAGTRVNIELPIDLP